MFTKARRAVGALALASGVVLAVAACGPSNSDSSSSSGSSLGTSLTVAWPADVASMDPIQPVTVQNRELVANTYEPLVQYATTAASDGTQVWNGTQVAPGLATSWTVKGAKITFTLRGGVKFYPTGDPMTANDVLYSYTRALEDPKGLAAFNLNLAGLFDPSQIHVDDSTHVTFTFLDKKGGKDLLLPTALATLRYPQHSILDSVEVKKHVTASDPWADTWLAAHTAGTGPYYVASHQSGTQVVLKAIPTYWGTKPHFTTITLRNTGSSDVSGLIKSGEVQYAASGITTNGLTDLQKSGYTVLTEQVPNQLRLQLAVDDGALKNQLVRQAIAYAVPYQEILQTAFAGRNQRAYSWDNPKSPDWTAAWKIYDTDDTKAKQLLTQSGVTGINLPIYYDSGASYDQDVALLIQSALAKVGITVTLHAQPTAQFYADNVAQAEYKSSSQNGLSLYTDGWWLDNAGPSTNVWIYSKGTGNWSHYDNPEVDKIHLANYTSTSASRNANYQHLQDLVAQDNPIIPLVVVGRSVVTAPGLTGDMVAPDGLSRFWSLTAKS